MGCKCARPCHRRVSPEEISSSESLNAAATATHHNQGRIENLIDSQSGLLADEASASPNIISNLFSALAQYCDRRIYKSDILAIVGMVSPAEQSNLLEWAGGNFDRIVAYLVQKREILKQDGVKIGNDLKHTIDSPVALQEYLLSKNHHHNNPERKRRRRAPHSPNNGIAADHVIEEASPTQQRTWPSQQTISPSDERDCRDHSKPAEGKPLVEKDFSQRRITEPTSSSYDSVAPNQDRTGPPGKELVETALMDQRSTADANETTIVAQSVAATVINKKLSEPQPVEASVGVTVVAPSPVSRRLAYFTSKYDIKSSISELSSPSHISGAIPTCYMSGAEESRSVTDDIINESSKMSHYTMPPWDELNDPDIVNNFWLDGPPPESRQLNGWHHLGDGKWTDPDGRIALSNKQLAKIHDWRRISELTVPTTGSSDNGQQGEDIRADTKKTAGHCVLGNDGLPLAPGTPLRPNVIRERPRAKSIRQGFVGDCSFLSSLASLAEYEYRMKAPVLSSILYPRKEMLKSNGLTQAIPVINPNGMYACKLYFNGVLRKVLIDDFVPVRKDGKVLSAHTSNKRDMWVTILEKAFIKLMGGTYFMHGSNPGADLFHLTGWVPETVPFRRDIHTGSPDLYSPVVTGGEESRQLSRDPKWDAVWKQLFHGFRHGCCVACLGTSEVVDAAPSGLDFPEGVSVSSGIVARHAYSIIDIKEIGDLRLLFIRNPWACIRWKGAYAPGDKQWTPALENICEYDSKAAARGDNGSFWIQWRDVVTWFSHLYICWNSTALPFEMALHSRWGYNSFVHQSLLLDDSHCVAYNPQFRLKIKPVLIESEQDLAMLDKLLHRNGRREGSSSADNHHPALIANIWILLSRHVRDRKKDLFQKYIACHVYEGYKRQKCQASPSQQGIYSNGECSLIRVQVRRPVRWTHELDPNEVAYWKRCGSVPVGRIVDDLRGNGLIDTVQVPSSTCPPIILDGENLVVVVSQYSQKSQFNFTLRVHSSVPCVMEEIPAMVDEQHSTSLQYIGEWTEDNAGGCSNHLWNYFKNPLIRLHVPMRCWMVMILECPSELSVNIRLFHGSVASARSLRTGRALSSGPYRAACCCIETEVEAGDYTIIPSTFRPGEKGAFRLVCHLNIPKAKIDELQVQYDRLIQILSNPVHHDHIYSLLPNGSIWNNHHQNIDLPALPYADLTPIPYPFLDPNINNHSFKVYQSKLKDDSFHALFALYPSTPITQIAVQLRVLGRLADWLLPSLRLFYKIDRRHPIFTRSHTEEQLLCLFGLEPVDALRYERDQELLPRNTTPGSRYSGQSDGFVGSFRRSDIEGGLSDDGKSPSTAADQFYHKKGICTISPVTLHTMGSEYGYFLLNVSTVPRDTVFCDNEVDSPGSSSASTTNAMAEHSLVFEQSIGSFELNIISSADLNVVRLRGAANEPLKLASCDV